MGFEHKLDDVMVVHLKDGRDVIAKVGLLYDEDVSTPDDSLPEPIGLRLYKPHTFVLVRGQHGPEPQFHPFLFMMGLLPALDHMDVEAYDYYLMRPIPAEMAADYLSSTSGIAVQSKPSIVLA